MGCNWSQAVGHFLCIARITLSISFVRLATVSMHGIKAATASDGSSSSFYRGFSTEGIETAAFSGLLLAVHTLCGISVRWAQKLDESVPYIRAAEQGSCPNLISFGSDFHAFVSRLCTDFRP